MRRTALGVVTTLCVLHGCGKSGAPAAQEDDRLVAYVASSATDSIVAIKAGLATADASLMFKCAQMANVAELEASARYQALAAELTQLCTADVPLAIVRVGVEKAEAARKAKPDDKALSECFSADVASGTDELETAGKLDLAKDLLARFKAVCPDA